MGYKKEICLLLLKNRRKSQYGKLDGNPLSLKHFKILDSSITEKELAELVELEILKTEEFRYRINDFDESNLTKEELEILSKQCNAELSVDELKTYRILKLKKISIKDSLETLKEKNIIECIEVRYDFKNAKISSGLYGINRVFLPTSDVFPTLVASDTNDYITLTNLKADNHDNYKEDFLEKVYFSGNYRKITKEEACEIQGFPKDFILPESRARWMKLIGNSVSVPVIDALTKAIIDTGVFGKKKKNVTKQIKHYKTPIKLKNTGVSA